MDWRDRKYYCVSFDWRSKDMRLEYIKLIDDRIKIHYCKHVSKQPDETEDRGHYQILLSVPSGCYDSVEYELRKAERNDDWCCWKEIKRKT